jgi:hypothetical protein
MQLLKQWFQIKKLNQNTGDDKPEPTFEDTYQTEFDRIQKLIGETILKV